MPSLRPIRRLPSVVGAALALTMAAACGPSVASGPTSSTSSATPSLSHSPSSGETSAPPASPSPTSCAASTIARLTPEQKAGQLVMVALQAGSPGASLSSVVQAQHIGGVVYLGGWKSGSADVTATSRILQGMATQEATGGIPLLLAADQEGGAVQQLQGPGFTRLPAAVEQAAQGPEAVRRYAATTGAELKAAGVLVDLAPVADTVPADLGKGNGPIGQWGRQFGSDPATVAASSDAFVAGLQSAGVAATLKHFPGIGRVQGNTDYTEQGIVDATMTADDPYLQPFRSGIEAGAQLVMLSSVFYPNIDPENPAMFSPAIIDVLLRQNLAFAGVAITDDVNAVAVRSVPVGERATRFVAAGGDIVLTGDTSSAPTLTGAIRDKATADPAFATKVDASLGRILELKSELGLLRCG